MSPNRGWCKVVPGDLSERWPGLRVPSANRLVDRGGGDGGLSRTLTLGFGILVGATLEVPTSRSPPDGRSRSRSRGTPSTVWWTPAPHQPW
jgi:hypothetical protein